MIVIHVDTMEDTAHLKRVYEGLDNVTLLYNESRQKVEEVLRTSDDDTVMCLGHGSPGGLFGAGWFGYVIDMKNAHLLRDKKVIGIWCYASTFADRAHLTGYFTSMFISNLGEAVGHGFPNNTEEDIYSEIDFFCDQIKSFIQHGTDMSCWVDILQDVCHKEKDFVRYNYEAMAYFDNSNYNFDDDEVEKEPKYSYSKYWDDDDDEDDETRNYSSRFPFWGKDDEMSDEDDELSDAERYKYDDLYGENFFGDYSVDSDLDL